MNSIRSFFRRMASAALLLLLGGALGLAADSPASTDVPHYTYDVIHTFPHDPTAFTQGLVYLNGVLYETTGLNGRSSLRKVALESGEVLQKADLSPDLFGEGM